MITDARPEPTAQEIAEGYREFVGHEVDLWHFPMMNDAVRNSGYEVALGGALKNGGVVLDIGTGSGLLAMMAVRQGATRVYTCEALPRIARKAREIIERNGMADRIVVINKRSTDLVVGVDLPERADVLVSEIFDDGLLGEGAFTAFQHAQTHLLKPRAQLIPAGVRVLAVGIESEEIFGNHRVSQAAGFDVSAFNEFSMEGYMGYHLDKMKYRALGKPREIFVFDLREIPKGQESAPFEYEVENSGVCHAVSYWYELRMNDSVTISTAPGQRQLSCWKQAVQLLPAPEKVNQGQVHRLEAHHDSDAIWFTSTSS
jgi:protein arginine N-methyltransferase 7